MFGTNCEPNLGEIYMEIGVKSLVAGVLLSSLCVVNTANAKSEKLEQAGDFLQWGIPTGAAFISAAKFDGEGLGQLIEGAFWTSLSTHVLKVSVNEERPNGRDYSFPSGHTSAAVQGAAYLQFRYGWQYGVPAYMLSGVVGYSRVENKYHYWHDVAAGAALATAIQYAITEAGFSVTNVAVAPTFDGDSIGVYASMKY
ncbi:phosphatase PAP2 family protein [Vibrio porteresiae]|uniref:Phosphatase PAP2 family protein n=1 Tax=Vibrio porteresiae DSM 19223 TaxID=1123496 RepID=A0ABZ0QKW1_9VIBR|nr:phosphatase PAP2 family protein [Vibrio porteresiae]WPC76066.1 phosphatase PAP2 family protein [Vibrio porteresiae DSM 19223]